MPKWHVEHNRGNKTQSQPMTELLPLIFSSQLSMTNFNMQVENSEFFVDMNKNMQN